MLFSSLVFLYLFLPICLLLHTVCKSIPLKNTVLLLLSLVFYAWGEPIYVFLMMGTSIFNWATALLLERKRESQQAKPILWITVGVDLFFLLLFKYTPFFVENINSLLHISIPVPALSLPIGISFYTFQTLSYVVDVYCGDTKAQKSMVNFMLYVALFPQLIAGPIVRYTDIAAQLTKRRVSSKGFSEGITKFLSGLGKKVLLANTAGALAVKLLDAPLESTTVLGSWLGIILYAFQIYFDFSGYSDMAIGLGRMFGFRYPENFNYPYISKSITEFWRRWHISLSSFFRDYVYIPLGGNRKHEIRNLFIVWGLTGFWHGANWNFICWGLFFFVFLLLEKKVLSRILEKTPSVIGHLYTLLVVLLSWVFFYYTDLSRGLGAFSAMFGFAGVPFTDSATTLMLKSNLPLLIICVVASTPIALQVKKSIRLAVRSHKKRSSRIAYYFTLAYNLILLLLCTAFMVGATYNPFLYFRF